MSVQNNFSPNTTNQALSIVQSVILEDIKPSIVSNQILCAQCNTTLAKKNLCSRCKEVNYCNADCQKAAWATHKLICNPNHWVEAIKGLKTQNVKIKGWDAVAYQLNDTIKNDFFTLYFGYSLLVQKLLEEIRAAALNNLSQPNPLGILKAELLIAMDRILTELKKQKSDVLPLSCFSMIEKTFKLYLEDTAILLFFSKNSKDLGAELFKIKIGMEIFFVENRHSLNCDLEIKDIVISDELLKTFGMDNKTSNILIEALPCAAYNLLEKGIINAKDYIFDFNTNNMENLLDVLKENNFKPTSKPKSGDLAVYFFDVNGTPIHTCRCLANGLVHSKLGFSVPYTMNHHLNEAAILYGKFVIFFSNT